MSVTATLVFEISDLVFADFHQHWLDGGTSLGVLATSLGASDTSASITLTSTSSFAGSPVLSVGSAILMGQEPMLVTALSGTSPVTATLTRGTAVSALAIPAVHALGATVQLLKYPSTYKMIASDAVLPYARQVSANLGERSAVFGYTISGTVTVNS